MKHKRLTFDERDFPRGFFPARLPNYGESLNANRERERAIISVQVRVQKQQRTLLERLNAERCGSFLLPVVENVPLLALYRKYKKHLSGLENKNQIARWFGLNLHPSKKVLTVSQFKKFERHGTFPLVRMRRFHVTENKLSYFTSFYHDNVETFRNANVKKPKTVNRIDFVPTSEAGKDLLIAINQRMLKDFSALRYERDEAMREAEKNIDRTEKGKNGVAIGEAKYRKAIADIEKRHALQARLFNASYNIERSKVSKPVVVSTVKQERPSMEKVSGWLRSYAISLMEHHADYSNMESYVVTHLADGKAIADVVNVAHGEDISLVQSPILKKHFLRYSWRDIEQESLYRIWQKVARENHSFILTKEYCKQIYNDVAEEYYRNDRRNIGLGVLQDMADLDTLMAGK